MTEVPEYLFERSRQRRIALGLLEDDGSGAAVASDSGDSDGGQISSGPSSADVIAAAKADAKLEQVTDIDLFEAISKLRVAQGVDVIEDYKNNRFPMPEDVKEKDNIAVGRIRTDLSNPNALELWLCGDQIRKGAALNAIQIAEILLQNNHE